MLFLSLDHAPLAPLSLADAYRHEAPARTLRADEPSEEAPLPGEDVVTDREEDKARFVRHRRLAHVGAYAMLGGVGLTVGTLFVVQAMDDMSGAHAFTAISVMTVGGLVAFAGEGLLFGGGIAAGRDARRLGDARGAALGWVGLGLAGGGLALYGASVGAVVNEGNPAVLATVGTVGLLAGFGCGVAQVVRIDTFAREHDLKVGLTPGGLQVAGRF